MLSLYHYCAAWTVDGNMHQSGGLVRTPEPVCLDNYGTFVDMISKRVGQELITLTSLSYLGEES